MRTSDRTKLDARLKALESRHEAASGARARVAARLDGIAARIEPMPAHEALAQLVAGLDAAPDTIGLAALRRAVARHV